MVGIGSGVARCAAGLGAASNAIVPLTRAPPPCSDAEAVHRRKVDDCLLRFWSPGDGYEARQRRVGHAVCGPSTYGEVTPVGARRIAQALGIDGDEGEPVIFADLGSGVGKLVAQSFLEWPRVSRAVGIELSSVRAQRASAAWSATVASGEAASLRAAALGLAGRTVDASGAAGGRHGLSLIEGDILEQAVVEEATHIYASSLCFDDALLARLGDRLSGAPRLRGLASLRRFPRRSLQGFRLTGSVDAEMSWTGLAGTRVFVYERQPAE